MDFQQMMQQAQKMQFKMQELQEKLADIEVEGESGGGLVKVLMTCRGDLQGIAIDLENIEDVETLEDLIIAAVNNANETKDETIKEETRKLMEQMGLPAGTQLPF